MWAPARLPRVIQVPTQATAPITLNMVNVTTRIPVTPAMMPMSSRSPTTNLAKTTRKPPYLSTARSARSR
jgi:hypothetical protein